MSCAYILCFAVGAALYGCNFAQPIDLQTNDCVNSAECASGVCTQGFCVAGPVSSFEVALEITPASTNDIAPPIVTQTIKDTTQWDVVVPASKTLYGHVHAGDVRVPAIVHITEMREEANSSVFQRIPLRTTSVKTFAERMNTGQVLEADFMTQVSGGKSYQLTVRPTSEEIDINGAKIAAFRQFPPFLMSVDSEDTSDVSLPMFIDVSYPNDDLLSCDAEQFTGCVLNGSLQNYNDEVLQVRAVHADTGEVVSSTALVTEGQFSIVVASDPSAYPYRVQVTGSTESRFPVYEYDPEQLWNDQQLKLPFPITVQYKGLVEDASAVPVTSASVRFIANERFDIFDESTQSHGYVDVSVVTDENNPGQFEIDLFPGTYDVIVTSSDPEHAIAYGEVTLQVPDEPNTVVQGQIWTVRTRCFLEGEVLSAENSPLSNVTAEATSQEVYASVRGRLSSTMTTSNGFFTLPLDAGNQALVVKPLDYTGFPWHISSPIDVLQTDLSVKSPITCPKLDRIFRLSSPTLLQGTITQPNGAPIAEAELSLWRKSSTETNSPPVLIATGRTMSDGSYQMFLPSDL